MPTKPSSTGSLRKLSEKDKKQYWIEELNKGEWAEIKLTKKGFVPKYTKIKHEDGTIATSAERPEVLADYFEKTQWGNKISAETRAGHEKVKEFRNNLLFDTPADIRTGDYALPELRRIIKKMKKGKAPGPDNIPMDLFKIMDDGNLNHVLALINNIKNGYAYPEQLTQADVVTIF